MHDAGSDKSKMILTQDRVTLAVGMGWIRHLVFTGDTCSKHPLWDKEWTARHISLEFRGGGHTNVKNVSHRVQRAFDCLRLDERRKGEGVDGEGNTGELQCKKVGQKHRIHIEN